MSSQDVRGRSYKEEREVEVNIRDLTPVHCLDACALFSMEGVGFNPP